MSWNTESAGEVDVKDFLVRPNKIRNKILLGTTAWKGILTNSLMWLASLVVQLRATV